MVWRDRCWCISVVPSHGSRRAVSTASDNSAAEAMPVEMMSGLPVEGAADQGEVDVLERRDFVSRHRAIRENQLRCRRRES